MEQTNVLRFGPGGARPSLVHVHVLPDEKWTTFSVSDKATAFDVAMRALVRLNASDGAVKNNARVEMKSIGPGNVASRVSMRDALVPQCAPDATGGICVVLTLGSERRAEKLMCCLL